MHGEMDRTRREIANGLPNISVRNIFEAPPCKGRLVAVGTGGPFVNKLDAEGALPAAFTQTTVAVLARTFAIVVPDALRADGVGVRLRSGKVQIISIRGIRPNAGGQE